MALFFEKTSTSRETGGKTAFKILPKKKASTHTRPKAPTISLDQPGRLRVAHMLSLLGVSHSHFYKQKQLGRYPEPDGHDGNMPYWNTATIKAFLDR